VEDIIRVKDSYYILSTSSLADDRTQVLKHNDTFAVFGRRGDIERVGAGVQGLYFQETRFLSRWVLRLGIDRPVLLSSTIKDDNSLLAVDLTNPDIYKEGRVVMPRGTLHIARLIFLWDGTQYEKLRIANYSLSAVEASFSLEFGADFSDIFEVRGMERAQRGQREKESVAPEHVSIRYHGLDGVTRSTTIHCSPQPPHLASGEFVLDVSLQPKDQLSYEFTISCDQSDAPAAHLSLEGASAQLEGRAKTTGVLRTEIYSENEQFNDWVNRSAADVRMMVTEKPTGPYPYGGVPWFSTAFGRDGIITALAVLWVDPSIARGVLGYLAETQATETDPERDAQPGKILHETRTGEMAALKEIPFGRYYGSVDATPLFVLLAGEYYRRTADLSFIQQIWPNIEAALRWMDDYGDADGDGFVEYARQTPHGLAQQGWKDSQDSVFHQDGSLARGPIALCEVQGYVYAAKRRAAELALMVGHKEFSRELLEQARRLRRRFEQCFWCEELSSYALALDGAKQPCRVVTSNAGQCLYTGIASRERARRVSETLFHPDSFCGWGVRTVRSSEIRYSPMSYHNGSVWPHDNALIARGLARYGLQREAMRILTGLLDASLFLELHRLPELFCGFHRRAGEGPTLYPVACSPQAWSAAAVFLILEACLGITIRSSPPLVLLRRTALPEALPAIQIRNLQINDAAVDFSIQRAGDSFNVTVIRRRGDLEIVSVK
jgi:glycogen debranching enzyme